MVAATFSLIRQPCLPSSSFSFSSHRFPVFHEHRFSSLLLITACPSTDSRSGSAQNTRDRASCSTVRRTDQRSGSRGVGLGGREGGADYVRVCVREVYAMCQAGGRPAIKGDVGGCLDGLEERLRGMRGTYLGLNLGRIPRGWVQGSRGLGKEVSTSTISRQ